MKPALQIRTVDDKAANRQLYEEVGRLMAQNDPDYAAIAELLDRPVTEIRSTIRKEREKMALMLLPVTFRRLAKYLGTSYQLLDKAMEALSARAEVEDWAEMPMKDLLEILRTLRQAPRDAERLIVYPSRAAEKDIESAADGRPSAGQVISALLQVAEMKEQRDRERRKIQVDDAEVVE